MHIELLSGDRCRLLVATETGRWNPEAVEFVGSLAAAHEKPPTVRVRLASEVDANVRHFVRKVFRQLPGGTNAHATCSRGHQRFRARFWRPSRGGLTGRLSHVSDFLVF